MLLEGTLQKGRELPLLEVLIQAGADVDFQRNGKGDTPLIEPRAWERKNWAQAVGCGSATRSTWIVRGDRTPLGRVLGADRLAERLIENVNPDLKDEKYRSSSLGWAVHGWCDPLAGNHGRQLEVVRLLVAAGATVEPEWMESEKIASRRAMLEVLKAADNYTSVRMVH